MKSLTAFCAIAIASLSTSAMAGSAGVKVGVLSCDIEAGVGYIIGSAKAAQCTFKNNKGRTETYEGSFGRFGVDIGVTGESKMAWIVFAPGKVKDGALAGSYSGVSAEATAGIGVGANVLVGGFRKTINLQPVSVKGQLGLNVAAGLTNMTLQAVK